MVPCTLVRDEKMLEKLATHEVESVTMIFSLADKCARAAHGTQPPKTETPRLVAPELPSRAVAKKEEQEPGSRGATSRRSGRCSSGTSCCGSGWGPEYAW